MRAWAASCALLGLALGACGFPDYGFAPGESTAKDGGAGGDAHHRDASAGAAGVGGLAGGGQGGQAGQGGERPRDGGADARPDAHAGCTADADCKGSAAGAICDLTDGQCVECRPGHGDCTLGTFCSALRFCEIGCERDADCAGAPSIPGDGGADAGKRDGGVRGKGDGGPPDAGRPRPRDASVDAGRSRDAGDAAIWTTTCDLGKHTCNGCHRDGDCPLGSSCDVGTERCVPGCSGGRPCPDGLACCAGECSNLRHSPAHCGSCDVSCARDAGLGACVGGACQGELCRPGFADCNRDSRDGCEVDLRADPSNCGACAAACLPPDNAAPACTDGVCGLGACNASFANCDGNPATGCEEYLVFNTIAPNNCGTCGFACNLLNAHSTCVASACQFTVCSSGYADCDKITSTGCEVNTQSDPSNCGACGNVCTFPSADATCLRGKCTRGPCRGDAADCNGNPADGCEVNTSSDVANCGGCVKPCGLAHATSTCTDGACEVAACDTGFGDCDGLAANGCETNLETNAGSCSACGVACSTNHGTASCALGACSVSCTSGFADCNVDPTDGCEINTSTNVEHCGSCLGVCSTTGGTPNCVSSKCGLSACGGTLADCNAKASDGCEVDTNSDLNNCGGCGKACFIPNGTAKCTGGACAIANCTAGFGDCNADASDGCETRLNTTADCGACKTPCTLANSNASCVTGSCQVASCVTPYADCDGKAVNGCETDTSKDAKNCGGCTNLCDTTNGTAKCLNSSCAITCNAGFANCDAKVSNGCEKATKNDVANCGACGAVCAVQNGTPACVGTTCTVASCTAPFADCDHLYATGCEANTDTRINNCGACGKVCDTSRGTPTCTAGICLTP